MIEHKFSEEDLRRYFKCEIHLEISSKGMEPSTFKNLSDASMFIGVQGKLSSMLISIRDLSSLEEKVESKSSTSSGLRCHNIYPSWININQTGRLKKTTKLFTSKMPHSTLKAKFCPLYLELLKVSCGQTFEYGLERDWDMKFRLHRKICPNPPEVYEQVQRTKKAMTHRERHRLMRLKQ